VAPSAAPNLAVNLLSNLGPVLLLGDIARIDYRMAWEPVATDLEAGAWAKT
jgi:hypothetical protein